jgi:hypothetical protein
VEVSVIWGLSRRIGGGKSPGRSVPVVKFSLYGIFPYRRE